MTASKKLETTRAPSSNWSGFEGLDPESDQSKSISQVLTKGDFSYLAGKALSIRKALPSFSDGDLDCVIDTKNFAYGMNNVVLRLTFSDSVVWVARVELPYEHFDHEVLEAIEVDILSEITTMQIVKERTTIPIPTVFGYELEKRNNFGFRYMLMDKLPGRPLTSGLALSLPKEHLEKVARQFADIYVQLSTITFDKIGRLYRKGKEVDVISFVIGDNDELASPLATSLEYFYLNVRSRNRATLQSVPSADRVEDFKTAGWVLGQSLTNVVIERAMYGPYPLCHMDLHHGNILFNEQYDITGIVDWTGAQTVPWERLAANIEFVTFPGLSREDNMPIVAFREKVAACLKEQWGSGLSVLNPLPELIGSRTAEIVCRCTCSFSKPWRALTDAMLVARLLYGPTVTWEDLKAFRNISSTNTVDISETDGLSAQFKKMFSKPQST